MFLTNVHKMSRGYIEIFVTREFEIQTAKFSDDHTKFPMKMHMHSSSAKVQAQYNIDSFRIRKFYCWFNAFGRSL
jgi:hypothetical protein